MVRSLLIHAVKAISRPRTRAMRSQTHNSHSSSRQRMRRRVSSESALNMRAVFFMLLWDVEIPVLWAGVFTPHCPSPFAQSSEGSLGKEPVQYFRCLMPHRLRRTVGIKCTGSLFSVFLVKTVNKQRIPFGSFQYLPDSYLVRRSGKKVAPCGPLLLFSIPAFLKLWNI